MKGAVIAGTHSGCGKTTVTLGILAALRKKGLTVQPFKAGPDFIDAGLHRLVTDRPSRNLDQWMCGPDYVIDCFHRYAALADISVVEGVMGMYDGDYSTAALAKLLNLPVILVVDGYGMAESAGAVVRGFAGFGAERVRSAECALHSSKHSLALGAGGVRNEEAQPELRTHNSEPTFAGVIFNRVASENHYRRLKDSVHDVPVLGYLPRDLNFAIPHRHLGLTTAAEDPITAENIDKLAATMMRYVNLDALCSGVAEKKQYSTRHNSELRTQHSTLRVAVAYDKAFSFYYEDNLDLLIDEGVEIIRFSPLVDPAIPDGADAVYIGGGYPEIHAAALSGNTAMLGSIRAWAEGGKPLYAECGGLMYLSRGIHDFDGNFLPMAGVFPFETRMTKKPRLGYREILLNEDCFTGGRGDTCRGHEFHYSEISEMQESWPVKRATQEDMAGEAGHAGSQESEKEVKRIYAVMDKAGARLGCEGFTYKNTLASYIHVHFGGKRTIARRFAAFVKGDGIA